MTLNPDDHPHPPSDGEPHRRRIRYRGKHPRRFDQKYKELNPQQYPGFHDHVRSRGDTPAGTHVPILVDAVMQALRPAAGAVVADGTLGFGGHALAFLNRIGPSGRLISFDVDGGQLERAGRRLREARPEARISLHRRNFAGLGQALAAEGLDGYDIILADLGVSSMQIDDPDRGFTYKHDGPLDMRMDDRLKRTAAELLSKLSEVELSAALADLADEPDHGRIARRIVEARRERPITRTGQLVQIVFEAKKLSPRDWRQEPAASQGGQRRELKPSQRILHPAARTFQALRVLVNDELGSLRQLLRSAPYCLRPGGRIGIITFHSGEDDLVRAAFAAGLACGDYGVAPEEPIRPTPEERRDNPRCSSARLRWAARAGGTPRLPTEEEADGQSA